MENMRGRGLPGCGRGVTAPISMKPKPAADSSSIVSPSGSYPAATPTGLGKAHAEHLAFEIGRTQRVTLRQQPFASGQGACCAQCRKGGVVCRFGIQQRERGPCRRIFHPRIIFDKNNKISITMYFRAKNTPAGSCKCCVCVRTLPVRRAAGASRLRCRNGCRSCGTYRSTI